MGCLDQHCLISQALLLAIEHQIPWPPQVWLQQSLCDVGFVQKNCGVGYGCLHLGFISSPKRAEGLGPQAPRATDALRTIYPMLWLPETLEIHPLPGKAVGDRLPPQKVHKAILCSTGPADQTIKSILSALRSNEICSTGFWTGLEPVTPFFFPLSSFSNGSFLSYVCLTLAFWKCIK